jgi:predicted DNA-binding transcriptional regulator AlpA
MSERLLRFADLKERGIVNNWPTLRRWIQYQGFPPGIVLGPNTRAWTESEIDAWLANRSAWSQDCAIAKMRRKAGAA